MALFAIGTGAAAEDQKTEGGGFAVALQGGVATGASETGVTLGGSMVYDVSPCLSDLRAIVVFGEDTRTLGVLNVGVGCRF